MPFAPLTHEIPYADPLTLFARVADDPYAALLHSAAHDARGRYSLIGAAPFSLLVCRDGVVEVDGAPVPDAPLEVVRAQLARFPQRPADGPGPFLGGAVGYLGYEMGRHLERVDRPPADAMDVPEMQLMLCDVVVVIDHLERRAHVVSTGRPETRDGPRRARARQRLEAAVARFADPPAPAEPPVPATAPLISPDLTRDAYEASVRRVVEYILAGDVFQANLSQRFRAELPVGIGALDVFRRLCAGNPAPFAAYLKLDDLVLASSSPERFVRVSGETVETRPIKGTRPRGATPDDDAALAAELVASEKDRAENVMIVDLLRNDLSRVCRDGTVDVPELCSLERFATVMHLVSAVTGRLRPDAGAIDVLAACFPGGSITGAPKIRAMEIIAELEPTRRGAYCGAIGYLGFDGAMDTSIVIRTMTIRGRDVTFQAGGGVVAASSPAGEYEETLTKAAALVRALSP